MAARREIRVLTDHDVVGLANMAELVRVCAHAVQADAANLLSAPARHAVDLGSGQIVFTTGGDDHAVGFRAYETMPGSKQDQVVAVWHRDSGELAGVVVGELLGAYRTGALGGVGVDAMAAADASRCAVIGTGVQARTQLMACAAVRDITTATVYSRDPERRRAFAAEMTEVVGVPVEPAGSVGEALDSAEVVLVATSSGEPVFELADLPDARVHVNTVGPKFGGYHELAVAVAEAATVVATDSPQQIAAHGDKHFLRQTSVWDRIGHVAQIPEDRSATGSDTGITLFLSAGLAGTEVLVADQLFRSA
jgi:ornithine cyclodeaminase